MIKTTVDLNEFLEDSLITTYPLGDGGDSIFVFNKTIQLKNVKTEKYGRVLAEVWYNNVCINTWLVKQRLAVEYDGGTKKKDFEELKSIRRSKGTLIEPLLMKVSMLILLV